MSEEQTIRSRVAAHIDKAEALISHASVTAAPEKVAELHLGVAQALSVLAALDSQKEAAQTMGRELKGNMAGLGDILGRILPPGEDPFPTV